MSPRRIEKVMLIYPPSVVGRESVNTCMPPMGACYIAAYIRNDYEVKVLDATVEGWHHRELLEYDMIRYGLSVDQIRQRIAEFEPDFVGVTCLFSSHMSMVRKICDIAKELNPEVITATGGTHPHFLAESCILHPNLDYIGLSECEETVRKLLAYINEEKNIAEIDGLVWKEDGQVKINPKTTWLQDLDVLPYPAWDLTPWKKYHEINVPHSVFPNRSVSAPVQTSRGCPCHCIFCSSANFWTRKYRMRSTENVLSELQHLKDNFGVDEVQFEDDNLTLNKKRALEIFKGMIERKMDLAWNMPNGLAMWTVDEEVAYYMGKSGCYEVAMAIESGDQEVLNKIVKKPLNLEKAAKVVKLLRKNGVWGSSFFIVGFPGETRQQIMNTFAYARRIKPDRAYFFIAQPLPGSEMYKICVRDNLLPADFDFEKNAFTRSQFNLSEMNSDELEKLVKKQMIYFNASLLFRNPIRFLKRYLPVVFRQPKWFLMVVKNVFTRSIKSDRTNKVGTGS